MNLNVLLAFDLQVSPVQSKYDWFEGDPSSLRQMSEHRHRNLKSVKISSFCPQKSMLELARHILENATSLERLTLDTICDNGSEDLDRTFDDGIARCYTVLN